MPQTRKISRRPGVTLATVAQSVGVTAATVSYVLRGQAERMGISRACVERVTKAAENLGYRGNFHARSLALGRSKTIGLAVGSGPISLFANPYWNAILVGIESRARNCGHDLLMVGGLAGDEPLERAMERLEEHRIDSLIVMSLLFADLPSAMLAADFPGVFIGDSQTAAPRITFDAEPGLRAALVHLSGLGHRTVLWLSNRPTKAQPHIASRLTFAKGVAATLPITLRSCFFPARTNPQEDLTTHYSKMLQGLTDLPQNCTAILCQDDWLAMTVITALRGRNIRVPQDVSVIGFDDYDQLAAVSPLTTISHRLPAMGSAAVDVAIRIGSGEFQNKVNFEERVPATLVVRTSTGSAGTTSNGNEK